MKQPEPVKAFFDWLERDRGDGPQPKTCRACQSETQILVHDPNDPTDCRRTVCGKCAGDSNRRVLDNLNRRGSDSPPPWDPEER